MSEAVHELPPELGPNAVAVLEGISFMYSNAAGDVPPGSIGGLVHEDTRLLNEAGDVAAWARSTDPDSVETGTLRRSIAASAFGSGQVCTRVAVEAGDQELPRLING